MIELAIKGENYRIAKLSVFEQLNVARKLLPVLAGIVAEFHGLRESSTAKETNRTAASVAPKIAEAIAGLSDADVNAVLFPCLQAVSRRHLNAWVPVCQQAEMAFDDIDLPVMLQLVARVVADSLGNFLQELPTSATSTLTTA